jgi:hypothetical protein
MEQNLKGIVLSPAARWWRWVAGVLKRRVAGVLKRRVAGVPAALGRGINILPERRQFVQRPTPLRIPTASVQI